MRMLKKMMLIMTFLAASVLAQQSSDYLTVEVPVGAQPASKALWVKWAGSSRGIGFLPPDSGFIYFDRAPGGANLANYRYKVTVPYVDTLRDSLSGQIKSLTAVNNRHIPGNPPLRTTAFRPVDQPGMGSGVFYCVVALPVPGVDTLYSNEFQILVESSNSVTTKGPQDTITSLTPTFSWDVNPGVPYYHVILSDQLVEIDTTSENGSLSLEGLSIVWQAITPGNQITYGAPDPSRTITAEPPPLTPGHVYTWIALNNYGNHAAYSSVKVGSGSLKTFVIKGVPLRKPVCIYPVDDSLNSKDNARIRFRWTNLDSKANTYKVYLYAGSQLEGIDAQMILWQAEVMGSDTKDTLGVEIDAASVLTSNRYTWRVIAIDDRGAGTSGGLERFHYTVPTGVLNISTKEQISVNDGGEVRSVTNPVGLVELKVEVLDGPMEAPLLFYTDTRGNLLRQRPTGTYRITAVKNEFESQSKTVILSENDTTDVTFYLERPQSTIFGGVYDISGHGINKARVYGISDHGDTSLTLTDASGNFMLRAYEADWRIAAELEGYRPSFAKKITVESGENYDFGEIFLEKNPVTLSGIVKNGSGNPLLGVKVLLLQDGVKINEIPSTPQSGTFSFSVPAGTYTLSTEKTGFTSYRQSFDVAGSRSVTVTMQAGAAIVNGFIYGRTWVGKREVVAPITNALIEFVEIGSSDTFSTLSDATYGDFKISLPGKKKYSVKSTANGFAAKMPCTLQTIAKTTMTFKDTLRGLGMFSGTVFSDGSTTGGVVVSLVDVKDAAVAATGKTSFQGQFEIKNIPDGMYMIMAGKEGFVLDSIDGPDTLEVSNGKCSPAASDIYLEPGSKTLKWHVLSSKKFSGVVKVQSPLRNTVSTTDSIINCGHGLYVINVDSRNTSLLDLAFHRFDVADSQTVHIDTVRMDVTHEPSDTLNPRRGKISLELSSDKSLDSAVLYYRDFSSSSFKSVKNLKPSDSFLFEFVPPRDGSNLIYYFRAYRGSDIYGYDKETFRTFIKPDTSRLTRFEITPSSDDTLILPPGYSARFSFKGYFSSSFIPAGNINPSSITWSLSNEQGCKLENRNGLAVTVKTGKTAVSSPVILSALIDTTITRVAGGSRFVSIPFRVSGSQLKAVNIKRVDAGYMDPITTSPTASAEFAVEALDGKGNTLNVTPVWSIFPRTAGQISSEGIFRPDRHFSGYVRVFADAGGIRSEYFPEGQKEKGLNVQFIITSKSEADTAHNGQGCMVIFPPNVAGNRETGKLNIAIETLQNQIKRSNGNFRTVDTVAFDITETKGISFDLSSDSIELVIDLPQSLHKQALQRNFTIACWDEDSLKWDPVHGSTVSADGKKISAKIGHFSIYSVMVETKLGGYLKVSPNPFSPYVWPRNITVEKHLGACIEFQVETSFLPADMKLRIYNVLGDLVWSLRIQDGNQFPYKVWWDGRTSEKDIIWSGNGNEIDKQGKKMCRNGRYMVVLTASDSNKSEWKLIKQIVLIK